MGLKFHYFYHAFEEGIGIAINASFFHGLFRAEKAVPILNEFFKQSHSVFLSAFFQIEM